MRYVILLLAFTFICCGNSSEEKKESKDQNVVTTYYLIRHAEKNRNEANNPGLTEIGKKRAMHWAEYFSKTQLDAVYSTNFNRTVQTAIPTAEQQGTTVKKYDANNLFDRNFENETKGKTVLVVGHSNTTPAMVNKMIGENKYTDIDDSENGMLYKVVLKGDNTAEVTIEKVDVPL